MRTNARVPSAGEPHQDTGRSGTQSRGAPRIRILGWDLGRNDHTDELDTRRPAEPLLCYFTPLPPEMLVER
jgi:hypothetical protein